MKNNEKNLAREKCLLQAVDELGQGSSLVWIVFIINLFTLQLFGLNSMAYVFIAEIPEFRCFIPELSDANWTTDQINEISIFDTCQHYDHNHTYLANLGYDRAVQFVEELEFLPNIISCSSFTFDNERSTIVDEWELVCEKKLYRATTFLLYALGITCGSGILGIYSDAYGRKKSLVISIVLQVIAGPASALAPWFWAYSLCRFITGMSTGGMYSSAFTILSEISKDKRRKVFAASIDSTFSIGIFFLIGIAHFLTNWRQIQLGISCFLIPIIALIWFIPESPRWLIAQNRYDEAQKIIEKYHKSFATTLSSSEENKKKESQLSSIANIPVLPKKEGSFFRRNFGSLGILLTTSDLRRKILVMYFSYYVTTVVSLSLVFSIDNFKADRYIYMSVVALNEIIAHMAILVVLMFVSPRKLLVIVYMIGAVLTISILAASEENKTMIMGLALAARFCTSASFTINLVLNTELFSSNVRNTALGTCVVTGQLGSLTAPYIVDILGSIAFWAPTTLCSVLFLLASLFGFILPRSKIEEEENPLGVKEDVTKS
ncbi:GSCOCG00001729001-RA-CDS [Cotesia congregata]|nr:GSCOCG00001729001-RA-CDS [Cotesia congregata]